MPSKFSFGKDADWLDTLLLGEQDCESVMVWWKQARAGDYFFTEDKATKQIALGVFSNVSPTGVGEHGSLWGLANTGKHMPAWQHTRHAPLGRLVLQEMSLVQGFISRELFFRFKAVGFLYATRPELSQQNPALERLLVESLSKSPYRADGSS